MRPTWNWRRVGAGLIIVAIAIAAVGALLWKFGDLRPSSMMTAAQPNAVDQLAARVARVETRLASPPSAAPDPQLNARLAAIEQSLRDLQRQIETMGTAIGEFKSAPGGPAAQVGQVGQVAPVDLSPLTARISELENAVRALPAESAPRNETPTVDPAMRRMLIATQLDNSVRRGEPFASILSAAKSVAADATALAPLEPFAASGLPTDAALSRDLLAVLPQLEDKPPVAQTGSGLLERLEASAARLVRIRPVGEAAGDDAAAVIGRLAAAARRNDVTSARRDLDRLSPQRRAPADAWIKRVDARDAALKASLQFAAEALAALPAKP